MCQHWLVVNSSLAKVVRELLVTEHVLMYHLTKNEMVNEN